jgi:protocatechuate 3,4-dioxygenase beta subunit
MIVRGHLVIAAALTYAAAVAAQQSTRDNASTPAGTATISGRILTDGTPQQPARRVRVTLNEVTRRVPGQTTTTDDTGAFAFRGLPAGRFELKAVKSAWLTTSYGASRPERPGTPIVVKDGEQITNLAVTIARGGVITGAVRDLRGRPVPGISVSVLKFGYNAATGERTLGAPSNGSANMTDDRGEYRAYGLPPGNYLVLANPTPNRSGGPGTEDIRVLTAADVQRALQSARGNGPAPAATAAASSTARVNYAAVFHPGATDIAAATMIPLGLGEERSGVDVTLQYVPTATVSGKVVLPEGILPASVTVRLVPTGGQTELLAGAGLSGATSRLDPEGAYMFSGVAPGLYTLKAATGDGRGRGGTGPAVPPMWARADLSVNGLNVTHGLTLQPGINITGRVVFEGSQPAPADLQTMVFTIVPPGSGGTVQAGAGTGGRVDAEGRFTLTGVTPDNYQFVMSWPSPGASKWAIKSSTANGRESFDAPLRVNPNEPVDWTITFTDKPTGVGGVFQDRAGRAATDYFILVFSADRKYWTPGSRRIRTMRPATDGAFSVKGLPAGEYFLAALIDLEPGEWNDPTLLESAAGSAIKVTLRDGEMTTQALRIGG